MGYAVLGRSGIHVSRIALGTMTFDNPLVPYSETAQFRD
jgi:aryl-alcohol dehydrogenase-like predicted oxidoreductase